MENKDTTMNTTAPAAPVAAAVSAPMAPQAPAGSFASRDNNRAPRGRSTGGRRPSRDGGRERVKPEFDTKIINIRRVTRVASGGRRFSFSVAVVSGDKKGRVGVGLGKAGDTSLAIDKATRDAKKHMVKSLMRNTPAVSFQSFLQKAAELSRVPLFETSLNLPE
jgi:hypothetical protein